MDPNNFDDMYGLFKALYQKFPLCRVWFVPFPGHLRIVHVDGRVQIKIGRAHV